MALRTLRYAFIVEDAAEARAVRDFCAGKIGKWRLAKLIGWRKIDREQCVTATIVIADSSYPSILASMRNYARVKVAGVKQVNVSFTIPEDVSNILDYLSMKHNKPRSEIIREALMLYLRTQGYL